MNRIAVAWDIDGTLIDSEPLHLEALLAVGERYGVDLQDLHGDTFRGVHIGDVWKALQPRFEGRVSANMWMSQITETYIERSGKLQPQPGAALAMESLARAGVAQVCVSNSNRRTVDANIAVLGVEPFIAFSISLDDVKYGKPDAEPYLQAALRLGIKPSSMVVVEDSASGVASGRAAGAVIVGYAPPGFPIYGVDALVDSLVDVPDAVRRLVSGQSQDAAR